MLCIGVIGVAFLAHLDDRPGQTFKFVAGVQESPYLMVATETRLSDTVKEGARASDLQGG